VGENLNYLLETSVNLATWTLSPLPATLGDVSGGMQTLQWTLPTAASKAFYRFVVQRK
jgi:hypothetical protein